MSDNDPNIESVNRFSGDALVNAREEMGLSAEALQRELRLTSKVVTAIEAGDLAGMGQPVFARGYIRSYCKRVGLDAEAFIAEYDLLLGESAPKKSSRMRNLGSVSAKPVSVAPVPRKKGGGLFSTVFKLVLLLIVIGGGYLAIQESGVNLGSIGIDNLLGDGEEVTEEDPNALAIPGVSAPTQPDPLAIPLPGAGAEPNAVGEEPSVESVIAVPPVVEEVEAQVEEAVETAVEAVARELQTEVATAPIVAEPAQPETEVAEPEVSGAEAATPNVESTTTTATDTPVAEGVSRLAISFADVSWVNIKDVSGESLFNGLAERGRTLELSGKTPISVVIGRADAVQSLSFNGSVVDLAPHTRKNVARLSLPL